MYRSVKDKGSKSYWIFGLEGKMPVSRLFQMDIFFQIPVFSPPNMLGYLAEGDREDKSWQTVMAVQWFMELKVKQPLKYKLWKPNLCKSSHDKDKIHVGKQME